MNSKFSDAILKKKSEGGIPVIPDIKCISPKEGDLMKGRDPVEEAKLLARIGAPVISVVTEPKDFGGSLKLLEMVVRETKLPVLRKDFLTGIDDLKRTKECGAESVLLMCAVQPQPLLCQLFEEAMRIGLEPLVEVHTMDEMIFVKKLGAKLVGINNRNILELEKDDGTVSVTKQLSANAPIDAVLVSESSICSHQEARQAIAAGADAVLIGTAIWQAKNIDHFYTELCHGKGANINE